MLNANEEKEEGRSTNKKTNKVPPPDITTNIGGGFVLVFYVETTIDTRINEHNAMVMNLRSKSIPQRLSELYREEFGHRGYSVTLEEIDFFLSQNNLINP